ncbi:MAG: hypothetical protein QNJ18_15180 [Xenococcaceae cyanobacterium MO_167.B52]|nr:hypothetical protein [Xenococcaceae cyanobacterium MO_167.B52]
MKEEAENLPVSFKQTVQLIERYVIQEIELETQKKQLYYHTVSHALAVKRRANIIFNTIHSQLEPQLNPLLLQRTQGLINIAAIAHDMVQEFVDNPDNTSPRKRERGVSEKATIIKLTQYIQNLNQKLAQTNYSPAIGISDRELTILKEAIEATICHSGLFEYSLYQLDLYHKQDLSLVAKILALADLGTLGMDGIEAYIQEGILIFLEDNLDITNFLNTFNHQEIPENIKSRILQATCFMVNFAKERNARFEREIDTFNPQIKTILREELFKNLNRGNIESINDLVPTRQNISLQELLLFISDWNHLSS